MSKSYLDYNKKDITDLASLYPVDIKNDFIDTLNETVFNRQLTNEKYSTAIGAIGTEDLSSSIRNIIESSKWKQDNQLQPVITSVSGPNYKFMTWSDFLNKLSQQDVDVDNYGEWGTVRQFNWVPPIDLDKFTNFRDYYWDTTKHGQNVPDYVTIKNRQEFRQTKFFEMLKRVSDKLFNVFIVEDTVPEDNSIFLDGNIASTFISGDYVIVTLPNGTKNISKILTSTYLPISKNTAVELEDKFNSVSSIQLTKLPCIHDAVEKNKYYIRGADYTQLFNEVNIFNVVEFNNINNILTLDSVSYDEDTNTTIVVSHETSTISDAKFISIDPIILMNYYEMFYTEGFDIDDTRDMLYKIMYSYRLNKIISEGTIFSNTNELFDSGSNFFAHGVTDDDFITITKNSGLKIEGSISKVDFDRVEFNSSNIHYVFDESGVHYEIYRMVQTEDFFAEPPFPYDGQFWIDTQEDALKQWVDTQNDWVVLVNNVDTLYQISKNQKITIKNNDWIDTNAWKHKTQLTTMTGMVRAQIPIIEYDDRLFLSTMVRTEHDWSYRASEDHEFRPSNTQPTLFELVDITIQDGTEFQFISDTEIKLSPKFGNISSSLKNGTGIVLSGFVSNSAIYSVQSSSYESLDGHEEYSTIIKLSSNILDVLDLPNGASIRPQLTSKGDRFDITSNQWRYDGVSDMYPSSIIPDKNPNYFNQIGGDTNIKYGYNWVAVPFFSNIQNPTISLDVLDSRYCLTDDYQEGDIRVYKNGIRQYGNFLEIPAEDDDRFVGSIKFTDGQLFVDGDVVLVEVGAYYVGDAGREAVEVLTPSGMELVNLSQYKMYEQTKSTINQDIEFIVTDLKNSEEHARSSKIFSYMEDDSAPVNPHMGKKLATKETNFGSSFVFKQHLKDGDKLIGYLFDTTNGAVQRTIWRHGNGNERYKPNLRDDGEWDIPKNWTHNLYHENRDVVSYTDLFTHFNSIISRQKNVAPYFINENPNYGLGGTIKEYNGNLDLLVSFMFYDSVSVEGLIEFAKRQYGEALFNIKNTILNNGGMFYNTSIASTSDLIDVITNNVIENISNDSKLSLYYGDTTMFDGIDGVENWILTLPMMGVVNAVRPHLLSDKSLNINSLVHHDGHISDVRLEPSEKELFYNKLDSSDSINFTRQTVQNSSDAFPPFGVVGNLLLRTVASEGSRVMYRSTGASWEEFDITNVIANVILNIETRLFNITENNHIKNIFDDLSDNNLYLDKTRMQFEKFIAESAEHRAVEFDPNDPFTWNYFHSIPSSLPSPFIHFSPSSNWKTLYEGIFKTPYPHLEPWRVQGYNSKPNWWDEEYFNVVAGEYANVMWDNVLDGIIPIGKVLPDGIAESTGAMGEAYTYDYLPVVTVPATPDGYEYGDLLPPFWNSSNNLGIASIRAIFDPNIGDELTATNAREVFGQGGSEEASWKENISYYYDSLVVAFKLNPLRFASELFGYDKFKVDCLVLDEYSSNITPANKSVFNGDEYGGSLFKSSGLNQWYTNYVRYSGYSNAELDFRQSWSDVDIKLSYLFDSMIDNSSFRIRSELFDLVSADWNIYPKLTERFDIKQIDAIDLTLLSIPSKYLGDVDKGWTVELSTIPSIKSPIKYYGVQNYNVILDGNNFVVGKDAVVDLGYTAASKVVLVDYGNGLRLQDSFDVPIGQIWSATIIIDGISFAIEINDSSNVSNVSEVIEYINGSIEGAFLDLDAGNIELRSDLDSNIQIIDNNLFSSIGSSFNSVSAQQVKDAKFNHTLYVRGNKTTAYVNKDELEISNSTFLDGLYTVINVRYDIINDVSIIEVVEDINIPNYGFVIDGLLSKIDALPLPDSWVDGTAVFFNSNSNVHGLILDRPYYLIRHDNFTFSIAETETQAGYGREKNLSDVFVTGSLSVGKIDRTFRVTLGDSTQIPWRVHSIDHRVVNSVYDGASVSGMQSVVDFLIGYSRFNDDLGFIIPNSYVDDESGRPYSWELYIEKFIDWAYKQRFIRQGNKLEYKVSANSNDDSFEFLDSNTPPWDTGTSVTLQPRNGGILPPPFTESDIIEIPYYIIKSVSGTGVRLALTQHDAKNGNAINFNQNSIGDVYMQVYTKIDDHPTFTYAPFKESIGIKHDVGITGNIHKAPSFIYSVNGDKIDTSQVYVSRKDSRTDVSLLGRIIDQNRNFDKGLFSYSTYIGGVKATINTYEHILSFEHYTTSGNLIYDSFIGLRNPRFITSFRRQDIKTKRPTMGGFALLDDTLVRNLEYEVNKTRYFYDDIALDGNDIHANSFWDSIGYDNSFNYMESLGINDKSQYIFWKGMIQNKGSNVAINAFTNNKILENAEVDEFFAYKVAEFGGNEQLEYLEMKMFTDECSSNELRIEFVRPDGVRSSSATSKVVPVSLKDPNRWWKQPDQVEAMAPYDTFFITTKPLFAMDYNDIIENTKVDHIGNRYVSLPINSEFVDVYYTEDGKRHDLVQNSEYFVYNNETITFDYSRVSEDILTKTSIIGLTYNNDAESVTKIIDKKSNVVIDDVPFWNPILGQYDPIYSAPIDIIASDDPAIYQEYDFEDGVWLGKNVGAIWFNTFNVGYVPYNDSSIFPKLEDRLFNWGKESDWCDIEILQWTESDFAPEEWSENNSGMPILSIEEDINYFNNSDDNLPPTWIELRDTHVDFFAGMLDVNNAPQVFGEVEVYVNGLYKFNRILTSSFEYLGLSLEFDKGSYIHLIKKAYMPSDEEFESGQYRSTYKHNVTERVDPVSGNIIRKYYFWVKNKTNTIYHKQRNYTLEGIKNGLSKCSMPYIIPHNVHFSDIGYGLIYGNIFDGFDSIELPYRYTQIVVKGLEGKIKDNDRYVLRFVKDFNLRDRLDTNSLKKKNVYEDWKLFREKQFNKIDRVLWNKVIESLIGYAMKDDFTAISNRPIPSMDRVVYDRIFKSDTRFGLGADQILIESDEGMNILKEELMNFYVNTTDSYRSIIDTLLFDSTSEIITSMNMIYALLPTEIINKIFFALLLVAMSKKKEYPDLFKTSWVAIQIVQDSKPKPPIRIEDDYLIIGDDCGDEEIIVTLTPIVPTPTPTPSITPSISVTPTPTPTITPSPTPLPNCYGEFNRVLEDDVARNTEEDECREVE